MNTLFFFLGAAGLIVFWVIFTYNGLVALRNRAKEAFSDIDVQLKRRYNLIPNLIETVKGYAAHEKNVLREVTEARAQAMTAQGTEQRATAENMLTESLKHLFAVAESYPNLKASTNFLELQRELRDTEDKVQASRRFYNRNVMALNTKLESFPVNAAAGPLGFAAMAFFEIEELSERELPQVKF
ncbi:MAG: LemA family protein [bacterium]|nr:LemA family protein [bacterium]MDZ4231786.1 LemA family protein [Candidatus Pacearchaeota archaeon]